MIFFSFNLCDLFRFSLNFFRGTLFAFEVKEGKNLFDYYAKNEHKVF
jgi:hypothetical protein